jgi:1-acyl-sn-glycerol-3-phosphate acyltransferase
MLPLQPGIAALASVTGLPVIPAATDSGLCWGRRTFRKRAGTIHLRVLPALPASLTREDLMQRLECVFRAGPLHPPVDKSVGTPSGQFPDDHKLA